VVLPETRGDNVGGPWISEGQRLIGPSIAAAFQSPSCVGGARGHHPFFEGTHDTVYLGGWRRQVFDRIGFSMSNWSVAKMMNSTYGLPCWQKDLAISKIQELISEGCFHRFSPDHVFS